MNTHTHTHTAMTPTTAPHITQLRQSLMDTLADLRDRKNPMDIDRAKAVASVATVLIDSARVENEYLKLTGQTISSFIEAPHDDTAPRLGTSGTPSAHNPFPVSARNRLGD